MRLFAKASSGLNAGPKSTGDLRRGPRRRVATLWPRLEARIGDQHLPVRDYGDGGLCVELLGADAPERAHVRLERDGRTVLKGVGLCVWSERGCAGYAVSQGATMVEARGARAALSERSGAPVRKRRRSLFGAGSAPPSPSAGPGADPAAASAATEGSDVDESWERGRRIDALRARIGR